MHAPKAPRLACDRDALGRALTLPPIVWDEQRAWRRINQGKLLERPPLLWDQCLPPEAMKRFPGSREKDGLHLPGRSRAQPGYGKSPRDVWAARSLADTQLFARIDSERAESEARDQQHRDARIGLEELARRICDQAGIR